MVNIIEAAIEYFAPRLALKRTRARYAKRTYNGAGVGRRNSAWRSYQTRPFLESFPLLLTGKDSSVPLLTYDSQIGVNLRFCADEKDRSNFDQRS
jgi:hypothetical protein